MDKDEDYWQGKEPKTSEELRTQINSAIEATRQWLWAADLKSEDSVMIEAQIFWLEQLIKLAKIELKK